MTERRLWIAVELVFLLAVTVVICLIAYEMIAGGSSFGESLVTLKELVWPVRGGVSDE